MNEHDDEFNASDYDIKEATRSGKLIGWCAILVTILLTAIAIYDKFIKPYMQP